MRNPLVVTHHASIGARRPDEVLGAIGMITAPFLALASVALLGTWLAVSAAIASLVVIAWTIMARGNYAARSAARREQRRRERARCRRLGTLCASRREQYTEMRSMVTRIERDDCLLAARLELEDLLDHYVSLLVSRERLESATEGTSRMPSTYGGPRTSRIAERRLAHHERCLRQIAQLEENVDAVVELVALAAQIAACPHVDLADGGIERRVCELDELDAAWATVSLESAGDGRGIARSEAP